MILGTHAKIMDQLPEFILNQLPCIIHDQRAIDKTLLDTIEVNINNGSSFAKEARSYAEINSNYHYQKCLQYYQCVTSKNSFNQPDQPNLNDFIGITVDNLGEWDPPKSNTDTADKSLTEEVVKLFYKERVESKKPFYDTMMKNLTATSVSLDITFKEAKSVTTHGLFSQNFVGKLNIMNEKGQVIGYWLMETESYNEVKGEVKKVLFPIINF